MITQPLRREIFSTTSCVSSNDQSCQLLVSDETATEPEPCHSSEEIVFGQENLMRNWRGDAGGCGGCWSLGPARGAIFSSIKEKYTSYVSTQNGIGSLSKLARDAAVKSISCEVLPNRIGSMLFTDNQEFALLSQTFFLKDSAARGFQRYFSVIVGSSERSHLMRSYKFLNQNIESLISLLCKKCDDNYYRETKGVSSRDLSEKLFLKRGENNEPGRNLSELAAEHSIFLTIHKKFGTIISCLESWRGETAVTGQPVKSSLVINQPRILLFASIFEALSVNSAKCLLYCLLAGQTLGISCLSRDLGRQVADSLALVLPNNKDRYFVNVVLTDKSDEHTFSNTLSVIRDASWPQYKFSSNICCCGSCRECRPVGNSLAVNKLLSVISCRSLNSCTLHTKVLTIVEGILLHSKIWAKLKSGSDKRNFLRRLQFNAKDANIFNFFQMFL